MLTELNSHTLAFTSGSRQFKHDFRDEHIEFSGLEDCSQRFKGLKGTVENINLPSLHGWLLEITITVHFN